MATIATSSNDTVYIPEAQDKVILPAATVTTAATQPTTGPTIFTVTDNPMGKYLIFAVLGYIAYKYLRR